MFIYRGQLVLPLRLAFGQHLRACLPGRQVDAQARLVLLAQHRQRRQHRAAVDVHQLQRHRQLALAQLLAAGVQALAQGLGVQFQQRRRVQPQVADDQGVAVARVPGQRQHQRQEAARRRETPGHVHQRLEQLHLVEHRVLAAQAVEEVVELGLALAEQPGHGDGRAHVGQRVVGLAVLQAVGLGQALQLQGDHALVVQRPLDAFRAQRVGGAHQVDEVPAAVAALPFAGIGVEEVAVEAVAGDFVVEAQGVVAGHAGARARQLGVQAGHELGFAQALLFQALRSDAGDQAGRRVRQYVVAGATIEVQRRLDLVERLVGADAGDLQRAVAARVDAGGLVVVPEDAGGHDALPWPGRAVYHPPAGCPEPRYGLWCRRGFFHITRDWLI